MGSKQSYFSEEQLEVYKELTYFTKPEIVNIFKRFYELDPEKLEADRDVRLPKEKLMTIPELFVNPFRDRFCDVFSSSKDGDMTFEDFLDMMSVFNEKAPLNVKTEYAFKIFDFDGDDLLSVNDLKEVVSRLTGTEKLPEDCLDQLIENIFKEADLDDDDTLSFAEFQHVISKSPDFKNAFRIRL